MLDSENKPISQIESCLHRDIFFDEQDTVTVTLASNEASCGIAPTVRCTEGGGVENAKPLLHVHLKPFRQTRRDRKAVPFCFRCRLSCGRTSTCHMYLRLPRTIPTTLAMRLSEYQSKSLESELVSILIRITQPQVFDEMHFVLLHHGQTPIISLFHQSCFRNIQMNKKYKNIFTLVSRF